MIKLARTLRRPKYFDFVVVGGGLSGISAALHLQNLGAEVVLLEASDRLGGRVATDSIDGFSAIGVFS